MNEELTIKEKIDKAYSAAWSALMNSLTESGVKFDDSDSCLWVDDTEEKKTYSFQIQMEECPEYGGED